MRWVNVLSDVLTVLKVNKKGIRPTLNYILLTSLLTGNKCNTPFSSLYLRFLQVILTEVFD